MIAIAKITEYQQKTRSGEPIRNASRVIFTDGQILDFMDKMLNREVIAHPLVKEYLASH